MRRTNATRATLTLAVLAVAALALLGVAATAFAASVPTIESESVSHVTATDATLEAEINLHEAPAGAYYQFQLVTDPSEYASEILCPPTLQPGTDGCIGSQGTALPIGFIPGNTLQPGSTVRASADVTLKPGTTYHYRVLVARRVQTEDTIEWEEPTVFGGDQTFTASSEEPPTIVSEGVSNITATDATLEAAIEPRAWHGAHYQFQLVKEASEYASEILCPPTLQPGTDGCVGSQGANALPIGWVPGNLANPLAAQTVQLDLTSAGITLKPSTTYHFRVIAARAVQTEDTIQWEPPTVFGPDQTFTTPSEPPPLNAQTSGTDGQLPAIQSLLPGSPSHHRRHRHHRRHKLGLHGASRTG